MELLVFLCYIMLNILGCFYPKKVFFASLLFFLIALPKIIKCYFVLKIDKGFWLAKILLLPSVITGFSSNSSEDKVLQFISGTMNYLTGISFVYYIKTKKECKDEWWIIKMA